MKKPPSLRRRTIGVTRTDADGFADNTSNALIILEVQRKEIDKLDLANALKLLHVLSANATNARRYKESLIFQIKGYDADPRELPEIPEVRAFFAALTEQWPHWLWFLPRKVGLLNLVLSLLCAVKVERGPKGSCSIELENEEEVLAKCAELFERSSALLSAQEIPAEALEASRAAALAEIA
jgi:hypothetical protein